MTATTILRSKCRILTVRASARGKWGPGEWNRDVYIAAVAVVGVTVTVLVQHCGSYIQFQYPSTLPIVLI